MRTPKWKVLLEKPGRSDGRTHVKGGGGERRARGRVGEGLTEAERDSRRRGFGQPKREEN